MKKTLLFLAFACIAISGVRAQNIINLGVNDDIKVTLAGLSGTNINVVLVIPAGYTNPQSVSVASTTTPVTYSWNSIDLSGLTNLSSTTKITIKGDGTKPTLTFKSISLPAALSKIAFKDLTITGAVPYSNVPGNAIDPTLNYVFNQVTGSPCAIDSISFDNCDISALRSMVRFQNSNATTAATQFANHVNINNCIVHNFADYGVVYNGSTGGFFGPVKVTKSTFYGFGATVFMLQKNSTSIDISDCTFDNVMNVTSGKAIVDFASVPHPTTLTNCIFGKAISGANSIIAGGATTSGVTTTGTLAITNCFTTSDWLANAPTASISIALPSSALTGAFTAYSGASTDLFTSVSVSSTTATPYTTTVGNYKIKAGTFAGANSAGDPRWYLNAVSAVNKVISDKGVLFNGTEILNPNGLSLEVYNVLGKKVASSITSISTASFQKGVYIVRAAGLNDSLKIFI